MNEEETFHLSPWVRSYVLEAEEGEGEGEEQDEQRGIGIVMMSW